MRALQLNSILSDAPECTWNIASIYDELSEFDKKMTKKASAAYKRLIAQVKSDAGVLARYGALLAREENDNPAYDESSAHSYLYDSYKYFPCDMDVISWLGAYFVKSEMYEKAIEYFQKAAQIQPKEVKWKLMVASCHRRVGELQKALRTYQDIERQHPDNFECLQYLCKICKELGMQEEGEAYSKKLTKADTEQHKQNAQLAPTGAFQQQDHYGGGSGAGGGGVRDSYGGYGEFHAVNSNTDEDADSGTPMVNGGGGGGARGGVGGTDSEAARVVAERAAAAGGKRNFSKARKDEEDDWGNDELGDDLLPM